MNKVIVVEDEQMVRRGIILTIDWSALNCVITGEAANGEDGAELALRLSPDIIITDVKMPRMDGVEMISFLREKGCKSKFIILTAHSDFKYAQSALRLGVSDYLLKPLKDGDLEHAIMQIQCNDDSQNVSPVLSFNAGNDGKNKYVVEAIHFIESHYNEEVTISTVANELSISEGYLSRVFKKETSYTFTNYLTLYRIKTAMGILKDVRVKVYEAAYMVGYSDTAYFSVQFKKFVGVSPSEYQDKCR